ITAAIASNPGGTPSLSNATATTNASGTASFSGLAINGLVGSYTLTFSASGLTSITSGTITLSAGAAAKLVITTQPSSSAQAGIAFAQQPALQLQDASGNAVSQSGTVVTASVATGPGGATLSNPTATTNASGAASFSGLAINGFVGSYTLSFGASGLTSITSGTITLSAGPAAKLVFTNPPTTTTAGATINGGSGGVQVTVEDQFGNVQSSPRQNITVATSGATLNGTLTVRTGIGTGVSTFSDLNITKTGTGYILQATAAGLTTANSTGFDITPAAADHLAFTVQPSDAVNGNAITPAVEVTVFDQFGNIANFNGTITLTVTGGGSGITGNSVSASAGVATFSNLILDTPGTYTLDADGGGLTTVQSGSFIIS
ncbi:MAG TPA: carboxypeptidase-like regulatory domain-containing protein, partial [Gemmatimonadales bacterium]|nr:carboxypeptidase-like regulatory domain-containing protein [Gemmatimonadales bacterium]